MCEYCWREAYMRMENHPSKSQAEHYHDLLEERKDNPCPEAAQKGIYCPDCDEPGVIVNKTRQYICPRCRREIKE